MSTGVITRPPLKCPNCGSMEVARIDEERVRCQTCQNITDIYEAMKQAAGGDMITFAEEKPSSVLARFPGLSEKPFTDAQRATLEQKIPPEEIDILPTGELYVSQVRYRRILNAAFGSGGWGLVPTGDFQQDGGTLCREYSLFAEGRFISCAMGEADFQPNNARYSKATAAESLKSNALIRCCKDLLVASECWDKRFCEEWKAANAVGVWCAGHPRSKEAGKKKQLWRRKDAPRFEYPWVEQGTKPPEIPEGSDDVPSVDLRADVREGGIPVPPPAPITSQNVTEREKPALQKPSGADLKFYEAMEAQKKRVGAKAYYAVLALGHGFEHCSQILDHDQREAIWKELKTWPDEEVRS